MARKKRKPLSEEKKEQRREYDRKRYHENPERKASSKRRAKEWCGRNLGKTVECKVSWAASNPDYWRKYNKTSHRRSSQRASHLKREYGITLEDYDMMLLTQNGRCAICGTDTPNGPGNRFHVDHHHDTGYVRGLLCHSCNVSLGGFKDSPAILARAIEYLTDNGHYGPTTIGGAKALS